MSLVHIRNNFMVLFWTRTAGAILLTETKLWQADSVMGNQPLHHLLLVGNNRGEQGSIGITSGRGHPSGISWWEARWDSLFLSLVGLLQHWGAAVCKGPDGVQRPARLHRRGRRRARAHQHGTVNVGCHHQDAEEDRSNDGSLYTQIVCSACYR